jgi:hypothetical protein
MHRRSPTPSTENKDRFTCIKFPLPSLRMAGLFIRGFRMAFLGFRERRFDRHPRFADRSEALTESKDPYTRNRYERLWVFRALHDVPP